jgi:hypothetical protein
VLPGMPPAVAPAAGPGPPADRAATISRRSLPGAARAPPSMA